MRAISYVLFGESPAYLRGIVENCERARRIYPEWRVYIWTDGTSPEAVLEQCEALGAVVRRVHSGNTDPMFLRLRMAEEVDVFLVRDVDCRLSRREAEAVHQWMESGKPFHLMHDHRMHRHPIMGGMWGAVTSALPNGFVNRIKLSNAYHNDQHWLANWLWSGHLEGRPDRYMHHHGSGWRCGFEIPFPSERWGNQFVGDTYFRESFLDKIDNRKA